MPKKMPAEGRGDFLRKMNKPQIEYCLLVDGAPVYLSMPETISKSGAGEMLKRIRVILFNAIVME